MGSVPGSLGYKVTNNFVICKIFQKKFTKRWGETIMTMPLTTISGLVSFERVADVEIVEIVEIVEKTPLRYHNGMAWKTKMKQTVI